MTTHFTTKHITGKGRGKFLGYPTINLEVPKDFELTDGIYATWVTITGTAFQGALHWGPIPTFDQEQKSLEVFLLEADDRLLERADLSVISVEIVKKIRDVIKFPNIQSLTKEIGNDVIAVRKILRD